MKKERDVSSVDSNSSCSNSNKTSTKTTTAAATTTTMATEEWRVGLVESTVD
jgi:hypothetical protein